MPWKIHVDPPAGVGGTYTAAVNKPHGFRRMGPIAHAAASVYDLEYMPATAAPAGFDVWDLGIIFHAVPPTREVTVRVLLAGAVKSEVIVKVTA